MRDNVKTLVTTAEPWHIWMKYPELADNVKVIGAHVLVYWEKEPSEHAVQGTIERAKLVRKQFPKKRVLLAEVGWPSHGRAQGQAEAKPAEQAIYLRTLLNRLNADGYEYFVIEAFDQPWKTGDEGDVGAYWGVYNEGRQQKFPFEGPVVAIPEWRSLAAVSIVLAVLAFGLLLIDGSGLKQRGRAFLALIAFGVASFLVFVAYDYSRQYLGLLEYVLGALLVLSAIGVFTVLFTEAHELAETIWATRRRSFASVREPRGVLPKVSVHVPCYNEPPEMMIRTLDALARLDYPHFEVLVIDNNTPDEETWRPVEAHCQALGPRFRFFHVRPLAGFKAGALNYALERTAPDAEIVAVIDADYIVEPTWLQYLTPHFGNDPRIAVVQAPQDYRDGDESLFKKLCYAEYKGFFHIGMVTRNDRDAIIQHGTMTMIRRDVLDRLRWGEWTITEDADLGLRVFAAGYSAAYVVESHGRGVMPDRFIDYKKQRFRWAYGAMQIMKRHAGMLFLGRDTALTRGQRYHFLAGWLPWCADGLNLFFTAGALVWTSAMLLVPKQALPPAMIFALPPLLLFFGKLAKILYVYLRHMRVPVGTSIGAAVAGLALSHTIGKAVIYGLVTRTIPFFRTPKLAMTRRRDAGAGGGARGALHPDPAVGRHGRAAGGARDGHHRRLCLAGDAAAAVAGLPGRGGDVLPRGDAAAREPAPARAAGQLRCRVPGARSCCCSPWRPAWRSGGCWGASSTCLARSPPASGCSARRTRRSPARERPADFVAAGRERLERDFALLAPQVGCVRIYSVRGMELIPEVAREHGMKVIAGAWISRDDADTEREIAGLIALANRYPDVISAVLVGNEVLLRRERTAAQLLGYMQRVQAAVAQPVSYGDVWDFWLQNPSIVAGADFVTIHLLPYWENDPSDIGAAIAAVTHAHDETATGIPRQGHPDRRDRLALAGTPARRRRARARQRGALRARLRGARRGRGLALQPDRGLRPAVEARAGRRRRRLLGAVRRDAPRQAHPAPARCPTCPNGAQCLGGCAAAGRRLAARRRRLACARAMLLATLAANGVVFHLQQMRLFSASAQRDRRGSCCWPRRPSSPRGSLAGACGTPAGAAWHDAAIGGAAALAAIEMLGLAFDSRYRHFPLAVFAAPALSAWLFAPATGAWRERNRALGGCSCLHAVRAVAGNAAEPAGAGLDRGDRADGGGLAARRCAPRRSAVVGRDVVGIHPDRWRSGRSAWSGSFGMNADLNSGVAISAAGTLRGPPARAVRSPPPARRSARCTAPARAARRTGLPARAARLQTAEAQVRGQCQHQRRGAEQLQVDRHADHGARTAQRAERVVEAGVGLGLDLHEPEAEGVQQREPRGTGRERRHEAASSGRRRRRCLLHP